MQPNTQSIPNPARPNRRVLKVVVLLLVIIIASGLLIGKRLVVNQTTISLALPTPVRVAVLADSIGTVGGVSRLIGVPHSGQMPDWLPVRL